MLIPPNKANGIAHFGLYVGLVFGLVSVSSSYLIQSFLNGESIFLQSVIGHATYLQFAMLFVAMLLVWRYGPKTQSVQDYSVIIFCAVIMRLILIPVEPYTSNDIDRYLFDGYITTQGLDPYRVNHDAPELQSARELWSPPPEHSKYVTLYPPIALALFSVAASTGVEYAHLTWKLMVTLASLVTLLLSILILKRAGKLQHLALVAVSPILIFESGVGVHLDMFSALSICLVLYFLQRKLLVGAAIFIGFGTAIKLLPFVLACPIVLALRNFKASLIFCSSLAFSLLLIYSSAYLLDLHPIGSIGTFFEKFRFGSPYFFLLETLLDLKLLAFINSVILLLGFSCIAIYTWLKSRTLLDEACVLAMLLAMALPLFLSPVIYPWYLAPLIPLIALSPRPLFVVWLGTLPFTYQVLGQFICCDQWRPSTWPLVLISLGMLASLIYSQYKLRVGQPRASAPHPTT
ncbi:MAG: alpha-1,6-mannosyltransferase [Lentisphaeria bacterium]|jgi:alpha-1,6-mannosyltransferase